MLKQAFNNLPPPPSWRLLCPPHPDGLTCCSPHRSPPVPREGFVVSVARFEEPCAWVTGLINENDGGDARGVFIANKGTTDLIFVDKNETKCVDVRRLPNVGKDQHSHLDFIVKMFDRLKNDASISMVVFCQGKIMDHQDVLSAPVRNEREFVHRLLQDARENPAGAISYPGVINQGMFTPRPSMRVPGEDPTGLDFGEWFRCFMHRPYPRDHPDLKCYKNAIFAVHKAYVLSRPKSFYEMLSRQFRDRRSEAAHFMERVWWYALNCDGDVGLQV